MHEIKDYLLFNKDHSIGDICKPLNHLGVKGFIYVKLYSDGTCVDLTTNLSMSENFLNKFFACKYSITDMKDNYLPIGISLWELNKHNKIWADCRERFNLGNGLSMALPSELGFTEMFFYYSDADNFRINELYLNNVNIFKNFSLYFKDKAKKIIDKAEKYKLTIPDHYKEIYLQIDNNKNDFNEIKNYYSLLNIKKFYFTDKDYLTFREAECLNCYAKGLTAKDTAKILNVSNKTIESHLDNIKLKLNCFNKTELVSTAINLGIFDFFKNKVLNDTGR